MIIGFDGNEANVEERVGVNVYAFEILWGLYNLVKKNYQDIRLIVYLSSKPCNDLPKEDKNLSYRVIPGKNLWVITKLMPSLYFNKGDRPDVFYTPSHYLPLVFTIPLVCSIMDLGYLEFSEQFRKRDYWQLKLWTAISIYISKYIIAISDSTRNDIVRHYPFASNKTFVTRLAYNAKMFNTKINEKDVRRVLKKYLIVGKYILFISTLKPSKNIEGLLEVWSNISPKLGGMKLVISGKKGWLFESIFEKVKDLNLSDSVIFTGFLPESDKPFLIKGAEALVLPSFWEGFGFDPLEAMAEGTPVIVSKVGGLPEVVAEAGIYIDPYNLKDLETAIKKVIFMPRVRYNKLVTQGLKQARKFSWEKSAGEILKVLTRANEK